MSFQNPQLANTTHTGFTCRRPHLADRLTVTQLGSLLIAATLPFSLAAHAQSCSMTTMQETARLAYPVLARAAHIQGTVVLMTTFQTDGKVSAITLIVGPDMLKGASTTYVRGLQASTSPGVRQCPIAVTFKLQEGALSCPTDLLALVQSFRRIDLQHVVLSGREACVETKPAAPPQSH